LSSITTINSGDLISTSRTDINTNFSNLNTDKIETSVLDTDTTLAANSDSKIATQKAVKAYVDSGGQQNASTTVRGLVEEATSAEVIAGTGTGGTGARLFVNPTLVAETGADKILKLKSTGLIDSSVLPTTVTNAKIYTVGAMDNAMVKTYFNIQLLFILWTGSTSGALTTDFTNWTRNSTDAVVYPGGAMCDFTGTGADYLSLLSFTLGSRGTNIKWDATATIILDWWADMAATNTGDIQMGFFRLPATGAIVAYNDNSANCERACFSLKSTGELYATIANNSASITNTQITGITVANRNNYRIELDLGTNVLFYINGVLKATLSGANLYTGTGEVGIGFGRSNTAAFSVTAPNFSQQMNG